MSHEFVYEQPRTEAPRVPALGDAAPAAAELARPSGPAAAVVLAVGVSAFALGLLSVLTAASHSVSDALTLSERVGDVSGLSVVAMVAFFGTWAVLGVVWRRADPPLLRVAAVAAVLVALGLLGTFPPFFNAVAG
jgi:hypothetical protein